MNSIFCHIQISEKDRSLLDERIKRAAKNRPTKSASSTRLSTPAVAASSPPTDDMEADYEEEQEEIAEPMEAVPELWVFFHVILQDCCHRADCIKR